MSSGFAKRSKAGICRPRTCKIELVWCMGKLSGQIGRPCKSTGAERRGSTRRRNAHDRHWRHWVSGRLAMAASPPHCFGDGAGATAGRVSPRIDAHPARAGVLAYRRAGNCPGLADTRNTDGGERGQGRPWICSRICPPAGRKPEPRPGSRTDQGARALLRTSRHDDSRSAETPRASGRSDS